MGNCLYKKELLISVQYVMEVQLVTFRKTVIQII